MLHRKNREKWRGKEGGTEGGELERICELSPQASGGGVEERPAAGGGEPTRRRGGTVEEQRPATDRGDEETRHERANERAIAARRGGMRETARQVRVRVRGRPRARLI